MTSASATTPLWGRSPSNSTTHPHTPTVWPGAEVSIITRKRSLLFLSNVPRFLFHNSSFSFVASIFGSSEIAMMERAITKDKFKELKQLPEWMSCDPEQQEQLKTVSLRKMLPSAPSALTRRMVSQPGKV